MKNEAPASGEAGPGRVSNAGAADTQTIARGQGARHPNAKLAESLARAGVPVFPCKERGGPKVEKAPYTSNGFKDASSGPETVAAWWRQWPAALPAIPTGAASGLAVIDGDVKKEPKPGEIDAHPDEPVGAPIGERQIDALGLRLPGAVEVRTPSGGVHLWHAHVDGAGCSTRQVADHVDERGEGGYAIAPGAALADGRSYSYTGRTLPDALQAGDLPAYPLEAVEAAKAERKAAQKPEKAATVPAPFRIDTGTHGGAAGATEADDAVKLDVLRAALAEAPNTLERGAWVGLAASLKVAYGESLRGDFIRFSCRYSGPGDACDEATAARLWESVHEPQITSIGPALAHLKGALGETRWKALWAEAFERHEADGGASPEKPDGVPPGFKWTPRGIYRLKENEDGEPQAIWLCSPLRVLALPRDPSGRSWGRLVEVADPDGNVHRAAIPASLFSGDGQAVRATLLDLGLQMASGKAARDALGDMLMQWRPKARAVTSDRLGWSDETCRAFVLGDGRVIGASDVVFQNEHAPEAAAAMKAAGTAEGWRDGVAALCAGNPLLVVSVSLAFSGPLLAPLGFEGGGLHLRGESSRGKTSALRAAASVWGSPDFVQPWRATSNGQEGVAVACNSTLYALDEMGEIDPHEAGKAAYMLANGVGKARATRSGLSRPAARWRVPVLSSGEISLADKLAEAGRKAKAGQAVRLLDIPADTRAHGAFDVLHEHPGGAAFSDAVKLATAAHYGHAGPSFVERFLADRGTVLAQVREASDVFAALAAERFDLGGDGQIKRAVARLGMVAAAGEMATAFGLTGWKPGEARDAALAVLGLWLDGRGGAGASEAREAIERTRDFITAHGESRFEAIQKDSDAPPVRDRAGWRDGGLFYVSPGAWREIHKGADPTRAARHLLAAGLLERGDGQNIQARLPREVQGRPRAYAVRSEIMGGGDD